MLSDHAYCVIQNIEAEIESFDTIEKEIHLHMLKQIRSELSFELGEDLRGRAGYHEAHPYTQLYVRVNEAIEKMEGQ